MVTRIANRVRPAISGPASRVSPRGKRLGHAHKAATETPEAPCFEIFVPSPHLSAHTTNVPLVSGAHHKRHPRSAYQQLTRLELHSSHYPPCHDRNQYMTDSKPVRAGDAPFVAEVEAGKSYFWCSCGKSQKQPFCDGSHKGSEFSPVKYVAEKSRQVFFCGCKSTQKAPFCDGSHNR